MSAMTPERLAAFVDGELPPEEAAKVVLHLADHPEDQALVDEMMAANLALQRAFGAPMAEPVPPAILATLGMGQVVPLRRRSVPLWVAVLGAGMAAAAVFVAVLPGAGVGLGVGPVAEDSALHQVLTARASGDATVLGDGSTLAVLATMPATDGWCREVERLGQGFSEVALACTEGAGWRVEVVLAEGLAPTPDGFVPASGDGSAALTPWLDRRGAGAVLSPDQERAALAAGWR